MKLYVGNCQSRFDCDLLIQQLQGQQVAACHGHMELEASNPYYHEYLSQTSALQQVGYNDHTVEYRHYTAGEHFSLEYAQWIGEIVGCTPLMCWVSEIRPGKCTPWHWDINPRENEHKKQGSLVRYFAFLSKPQPGHIFVTEYDAYYNELQGTIYQYSDIHAWHAGSNVGLTPKYLLTLTGYQ
jgi:hypothetical protein